MASQTWERRRKDQKVIAGYPMRATAGVALTANLERVGSASDKTYTPPTPRPRHHRFKDHRFAASATESIDRRLRCRYRLAAPEAPTTARSDTMVTDAAAMAVVKAARPAFRGAHDGVAFAANAAFLAAGHSLCAVGPAALTDPPPTVDEEVGINGWNSMDNCYAFLYTKEEGGKKKRILMKCLVIDDFLAIFVLDLEAQHKEPCNVQINVKDFFSEEQPKNYKDMYKNFTGFIYTINSSLLVKLDGKDSAAAQKPDVESSSSINSSEHVLRENPTTGTTEPAGLIYPPVAPFGHDDLFPAPGAGFYPQSGGRGGGGMHVGPNDPRFFPSNPFPAPFGGPGPGSVPPGARYDPIGPPDVPGFEPSRFVRRSRHPGGGAHPDLEFFQQGPDF